MHFPPTNVACVLLAVMATLCAAAVVRTVAARRSPGKKAVARLGSLVVWWVLVGSLLLAVVLERLGGVLLAAAVSALALYELLGLTKRSRDYRGAQAAVWLALPLHYLCVYLGRRELVWTLIPVGLPMAAALLMLRSGRTAGYLNAAAGLVWGTLLTVFFVSHAALLWWLPPERNPAAGNAGWFVYLLLLTQFNDIAQALWGRALGRRKITPVVSPGKTWEGFLLGIATTIVLAVLLAVPLTPLADGVPLTVAGRTSTIAWLPAVVAGLIISLGGFLGDLNMSAFKRDLGIKDSGNILPGQGGILDRIDSLTFTAPLFFYYTAALYGIAP